MFANFSSNVGLNFILHVRNCSCETNIKLAFVCNVLQQSSDVADDVTDDDVEQLLTRRRRSIERDNADTLQTRSLCSWSYVVDHNENRKPVDIQKAANCVNRVAGDTTNACYLIYFWTPVRTGYLASDGKLAWYDDWVRLPVGCTLANRPNYTPAPTTTIATPFPII